MTETERKEFEELKATVEALKNKAVAVNNWKTFRDFTTEHNMGRQHLKTLIARGKVVCDKTNCMTDRLGRPHGVYLYKWA